MEDNNIFARRLREKAENEPGPFSHPAVPEGRKRVMIESIEATTDKATLIVVKNTTRKIWIPKSVSILRWGNEKRGITQEDKSDVMDIEQDFYEQTIG